MRYTYDNSEDANDFEDDINEATNSSVEHLLNDVKDMGDLYFLVLLILSKMEKSSKYSMMSELSYLLDSQSFINLLWYYEGQTIRVPTREELSEALKMMLIYYHYHILEKPWRDSLLAVGYPDDKRLHNKTWTKYKKFLRELENIELPKKLRRPTLDDALKLEEKS